MNTNKLLQSRPDTRNTVLKTFNRTEESIAEDVATIKEWFKSQPHLPEIMKDDVIERMILNNKCSIENTKEKIDMYYTIRRLIPELFENTNPKLPHMKEVAKAVYAILLPKLTKEHHRVFITKVNEEFDISNTFNGYDYFAGTYNTAEVRLHEELAISTIMVYDCKGLTIKYLSKINPFVLKRTALVMEKVYSNRFAAIHIFNAPPYLDSFFNVVKTLVKPKLAERMHFHKHNESLIDYFDKEILPSDYGGDEISLKELQELWVKKFDEYSERFDELDKLRVNESLRPFKLVSDDILGYYGNFKALNVD